MIQIIWKNEFTIGYPYFNLAIKIDNDKTNVIKLAMMIGRLWVKNPKINHKKTPKTKIKNIEKEISFVFLVFQHFTTWGRNANVVKKPAK